jgi:hypothetical protein
MLIYIKRGGEITGPYSVEEARQHVLAGKLSLSDLTQSEGTTEWRALASVVGVKSVPPRPAVPETQSSRPANPPIGSPKQKKRSKDLLSGPVIRDFLMVLGAQAIGILIVKLGAGGSQGDDGTGFACLLSGTVGFAISGCLATGNRWEHLGKVAALTMFAYITLGQLLRSS